MPNCFKLRKRGEKEAVSLAEFDTELWIKFEGAEPKGNTTWYRAWYDNIGLLLACGKSMTEIMDIYDGTNLHHVAHYIAENYVADSWFEHKGRG